MAEFFCNLERILRQKMLCLFCREILHQVTWRGERGKIFQGSNASALLPFMPCSCTSHANAKKEYSYAIGIFLDAFHYDYAVDVAEEKCNGHYIKAESL